MNHRDIQVIGLCRFSYPALGGFQVQHETIEDRIRYLYADHRLEERFRLFESIALPCLKRQTDPNFDMILLIGDSLPAVHRARLQDITAGIPQIRIVEHEPGPHRAVMKSVINAARRDPDQPCLQFRFDDDDAVSVDFVQNLRHTAWQCRDFLKHKRLAAIDFSRGYLARIGPDGISATDEVLAPWTTAALAMYVRGGNSQTIMNFAHHKLPQFMPALSMPDDPMWVRTHNDYNDSRQKKVKVPQMQALTPAQETRFAALFGIDADRIRQTFARA